MCLSKQGFLLILWGSITGQAEVTEDFDQKICKAECVAPKNKLSNKTFLESFKPIFLQETDV
jgi:hypothetical protein